MKKLARPGQLGQAGYLSIPRHLFSIRKPGSQFSLIFLIAWTRRSDSRARRSDGSEINRTRVKRGETYSKRIMRARVKTPPSMMLPSSHAGGIFHERLRNSLTQLSTPVAENEKQLVFSADATKEIKPTEQNLQQWRIWSTLFSSFQAKIRALSQSLSIKRTRLSRSL